MAQPRIQNDGWFWSAQRRLLQYIRPEILTQGLSQQSACYPHHFPLSNLSAGEIANCWVILSSSWAAQQLHKPPPDKRPQSLIQKQS